MRWLQTLNFFAARALPFRDVFRTYADHSGFRFYVQPRDVIGRHIAKYGAHEPAITGWIDGLLSRAAPGIVVDVGANIGWHAIHAARHPSVNTVVAFEPDSFNAWLLERNLAINAIEKVVVLSAAVGNATGTARLNRYKGSNNGKHSLAVDHGVSSRMVPLTSIDASLAALHLQDQPIALIKIDVEGYEPAVIEGATEALQRTAAVLTEFSPELSRSGGLSLPVMVDRLIAAGFTAFVLRDGQLVATPADALKRETDQIDVIWLRQPAAISA
jgi:FkbM family methyltransferase